MENMEKNISLPIVMLTLLIVFGIVFLLLGNRSKPTASETNIVEAAKPLNHKKLTRAEKVVESARSTESLQPKVAVEDFFVRLPEKEIVESAVEPQPMVAQNGNSKADDNVNETEPVVMDAVAEQSKLEPLQPLSPQLLEPIVENVIVEKVLEAETGTEPKTKAEFKFEAEPMLQSNSVEKKLKWIPFVYFYQQNNQRGFCGRRASSQIFIVPLAPVTKCEPKPMPVVPQQPMPLQPLIPVLYGPMPIARPIVPIIPVVPVCPQPVVFIF